MRLPYDLIVFDLEEDYGNIIEIGAVKFLRDGTIGDTFTTFIASKVLLSDSIKSLTGIADSDMHAAPTFKRVLEDFYEWASKESKNIVLCSWGSDSRDLRYSCSKNGIEFPFRNKAIDAGSIFIWMSAMFNIEKGKDSLDSAVVRLGKKFKGKQHRALDDAMNTAMILKDLWERYEWNSKDILDSLKRIGIK